MKGEPRNSTGTEHHPRIRVLLVGDHPFFLEGLRRFLQAHMDLEIVGEASDPQTAVDQAQALQPDVVVLDLNKGDKLEVERQLRAAAPHSKVLMVTTDDTRDVAWQAAEAGASGSVNKSSPPSAVKLAIETVHSGGTFFPVPPLGDGGERDSQAGAKGAELSLRERQVLRLICGGKSNKEAAGALGLSVRTVEKHRERIMHKLGLHSVVELTKFAVAKGLIQAE